MTCITCVMYLVNEGSIQYLLMKDCLHRYIDGRVNKPTIFKSLIRKVINVCVYLKTLALILYCISLLLNVLIQSM